MRNITEETKAGNAVFKEHLNAGALEDMVAKSVLMSRQSRKRHNFG